MVLRRGWYFASLHWSSASARSVAWKLSWRRGLADYVLASLATMCRGQWHARGSWVGGWRNSGDGRFRNAWREQHL